MDTDQATPTSRRESSRSKRVLTDAEIRDILENEEFFDSSDIELSDDDDISDKTYHPGANDPNVELQDDTDSEISESPEATDQGPGPSTQRVFLENR